MTHSESPEALCEEQTKFKLIFNVLISIIACLWEKQQYFSKEWMNHSLESNQWINWSGSQNQSEWFMIQIWPEWVTAAPSANNRLHFGLFITQSYHMTSENLKYDVWVICTTFTMFLQSVWSLKAPVSIHLYSTEKTKSYYYETTLWWVNDEWV